MFLTKMFLNISAPISTKHPAQQPPTTSRMLGDVSREVIHTTEQTDGVCVSNMAPNKEDDPSLFIPKWNAYQAVEKQEDQESSERSHMPSSDNGRIDAADDRQHLQTVDETVPSGKSHGKVHGEKKKNLVSTELCAAQRAIQKEELDGRLERASSQIASNVATNQRQYSAQQVRADDGVENDSIYQLETSPTNVGPSYPGPTDRVDFSAVDKISADDVSDKLFKSSNDLKNSQQQTNNEAVLSNQINISSSALGGVGGTHSAQNAGRSEDEKEMRRNAHSSSTKLSKKKERELDVVHPLNAIGAAKSAATGNVAKGSDSSYSAAAGSEKCTNVALEEEQSAELEPVRLSLFVYFFFNKKVLLSMLANDLACSIGIVYLSNTFRTDKRFFRPYFLVEMFNKYLNFSPEKYM